MMSNKKTVIYSNKTYNFKENIALDDGITVDAQIQFKDKDNKILGTPDKTTLTIKDKKVSYPVNVEALAQSKNVALENIFYVEGSIDVNHDKIYQATEKTIVELIPMILKSDLFKPSETLNKLAVKRSQGYKKGIKDNEEVKLIQKALVKVGLDLRKKCRY
ncbi:hypothetical protein P4S72_04380 [Vibrio sp. PP-XX7]